MASCTASSHVETLQRDPDDAAEHVLDGFGELDVHSDVAAGMQRLSEAGIRMATLTNGAAEFAARLLERAALADLVERRFSVDEVRRWKPALEATSTRRANPRSRRSSTR